MFCHENEFLMALLTTTGLEALAREVRLYVFGQAASAANVPQAVQIAEALKRPVEEIHEALRHLAAGKVLILAPNDGNIWAANPFCAVPSGFRVEAEGKVYWGICIWDALGVPAALTKDAVISAFCGDCSEPMRLEVRGGKLVRSEGLIHFAIPAHHWWDNIGFT
jgi:Alkylmercury lyase